MAVAELIEKVVKLRNNKAADLSQHAQTRLEKHAEQVHYYLFLCSFLAYT